MVVGVQILSRGQQKNLIKKKNQNKRYHLITSILK
jgi:hypothetical protein